MIRYTLAQISDSSFWQTIKKHLQNSIYLSERTYMMKNLIFTEIRNHRQTTLAQSNNEIIDFVFFNSLFVAAQNKRKTKIIERNEICLLYTSPSPRDRTRSRMPSSA